MAHTFPRARSARTASFAVLLLLATALVSLTASTADAAPAAVSLPGTFDSEIGCSGDWQPDCPRAQLAQRSDGRWAAAFALPAAATSTRSRSTTAGRRTTARAARRAAPTCP
ncbi:hypothetical protein ACFQ1I_09170 [Kitasatospora arboriphila]